MPLIGLAVILAVNLLAPGTAEVQQAPKVYRVGTLRQGLPPAPGSQPGILQETLHKALHDLGYIEGRNIVFDHRYAEGKNERFSSLAAALVALKPDVVIAETTPAVIAAMHATATIPIVMVNVSDPVASGLVASLARPGGNVTGVADYGTEMQIKGVELLRTAVRKTKRLAALMSDNPVHAAQLKTVQDAARSLGLTVLPSIVKSLEEFEGAFASMKRGNADALIVFGGAPFGTPAQRDKLIELAAKAKLPTMYRGRWWVEAGGLLSYGGIALNRLSSVATYVDKILKGAKPGDLPIEQPTKFELVINMKTAKALGLTIPQSVLQRADQIIE